MTRGGLAVAVAVAVSAPTVAGTAPHKVLVLPAEGTADAATRGKLTAQIARLARRLDGTIATGDATFSDTALAVGCAPEASGCSDEVMATLGVDELVWATATRDAGQIRLIVRRAARGTATREQVLTVSAGAATADRLDGELGPLFAPPPSEPPIASPGATPNPAGPRPPAIGGAAGTEPAAPAAGAASASPATALEADHGRNDHNTALGIAIGGAVAAGVGIALWTSYSGLQDQIDHHPNRTSDEINDLISLENRAQTYAISGDVLVIAGLAAGGLAAYYLLRDHHAHAVAIAPAPVAHGGGLTLTIAGGL
ncbi:MAG TPA: hypothetical protein VH165_04555 [Kofleriaceae bacterium]|nr:hypothetical protein [Kofleriaceae bacterium]